MFTGIAYVIHSNNEHYVRLQSLRELIQGSYRKDIITGNLSEYLLDGAACAIWTPKVAR